MSCSISVVLPEPEKPATPNTFVGNAFMRPFYLPQEDCRSSERFPKLSLNNGRSSGGSAPEICQMTYFRTSAIASCRHASIEWLLYCN
jgi:hypothetical protein